jgi:chromosome segregation ATPase
MSEERVDSSYQTAGVPRWLALALIVPVAISIWALWSSANARQATQAAEQAAAEQSKALRASVDQLQQQLSVSDQERRTAETQLATVSDQLHKTQGAVGATRKQNKALADQLTDVESNVSGVRQELATKASGADVEGLGNDVKGIHSDLDAQKQNLTMARSEMGTLIARNHEEVEQLKRLGLRDYYEFTLQRKGDSKQVGGVTVELRGTNPKHHEYTVTLVVDDMKLEKKNRSINEPIFFYTAGSRQSLELVVNQVGKNKVSGYLSAPKGTTSAAAVQSSGN